MEKFLDQHGVEVKIGDTIIFQHARTGGNTALKKDKIVGFTKKGRPQITGKKWVYDTPDGRWIQGCELKAIEYPQTLLCNFAKGHES